MREITELEYATSKVEMLLAAKIENFGYCKYLIAADFQKDLGIDNDTLDSYLSGTYPFTLKELCKIAYVLEISVKDLFDFS